MADLHHALGLAAAAEAGVRGLMERALAEQRYRDLAEVAPLADSLAEAVRRYRTAGKGDGKGTGAGAGSAPVKPKPVRKGDEYPKFERDGDKLVKIGWSKKDRREYEHRAPREAVMWTAGRMSEMAPAGKVFTMDRVLPVQGENGKEVPSYQVYLALAWFREIGAVEERGKEGYSWGAGALEPAQMDAAWEQLARR